MHKFKLIHNNVYIKFNQCVHSVEQSNKHNSILQYSVVFIHFNYIKYKPSQTYILSSIVLNKLQYPIYFFLIIL